MYAQSCRFNGKRVPFTHSKRHILFVILILIFFSLLFFSILLLAMGEVNKQHIEIHVIFSIFSVVVNVNESHLFVKQHREEQQ